VLRHDGPSLAKTPEQQRYLNKIRRVTPYATLADLGILPVVRPQPAVLKLHRDTPGERGVVTFATPGQATVVVGPSPIRRELFKTLSDTSPNLSYMNGQSRWRPVQRRTGVDAGQVLYVDLQDPRALQRYLKSRQEEGLAEICETVGLGEDITPWLQEEALQNGAYKKLGTMARRLVDGLEGLSEQNRPSVVLVNNLDDVSTSRLWRMPPPDTALVVGTNDASHWQGASHLAIVNEGGIVALGATEMMLDGQPNLVRDEQAYGEWLSAATSGGNGHGLHLDFG
jgi:hypothetical protein